MSAVTEEQRTETDAPLLHIGGESFEVVAHVPHWNLLRLASAMDSGDDMRALAGMYRFFELLVVPEEWERFDAHMSTLDLGNADLEHAIGDVLVAQAGRGKGSGVPSGHSSGGSPTDSTPPSSRVVSFSRGTVEVVADESGEKTSSTD